MSRELKIHDKVEQLLIQERICSLERDQLRTCLHSQFARAALVEHSRLQSEQQRTAMRSAADICCRTMLNTDSGQLTQSAAKRAFDFCSACYIMKAHSGLAEAQARKKEEELQGAYTDLHLAWAAAGKKEQLLMEKRQRLQGLVKVICHSFEQIELEERTAFVLARENDGLC